MQLFGEVSLDERNRWVIQCEPHVRARLKRVFASAPQSAADRILISNTPEHARDLEWFLERFPMRVVDRKALAAQARAHRKSEEAVDALLSARVAPTKVALAKPPREYQEQAAALLEIKKGYLLADDVGVGKTVSGICCLPGGKSLPAVVVVPAHLPRHWKEKLAEFVPDLRVHVIRTSQPYELVRKGRSGPRDLWTDRIPDVLIVSYHKLRGWAERLAQITQLVIFEECQQLRNPNSDIYRACQYLANASQRRLGLSATPIYGYGSEFFWVLDVLAPGALGTREEFVREWCSGFTGQEMIKDTARFSAYLHREGLMLRRTRKDVGRELPPIQKLIHTVDTDVDVLSKMEGGALELARVIVSRNEAFRGQKMQAAGEFDVLLRQATGVAKAPYVADFVRMLLESGEPVLLFGWHRAVYDIWRERLADFKPVLYTGSESPAMKAETERLFKSGERKLMVMSLRSGAGVDGLQHICRTAVVGELDWSPGVLEQCLGRLDRDGQTDSVAAYFLLSEHGADPVMVDVLGIKREQIEGVRNPHAAILERLEPAEAHVRKLAAAYLARHGEAEPSTGGPEGPPADLG